MTPGRSNLVWSVFLPGSPVTGTGNEQLFTPAATFPAYPTPPLPAALSSWSYTLKGVLDRVAALAGLVLLAPLMLLAGLAIRLDSPGPAVIRQPCVGFRGRAFNCVKFRSTTRPANGLAPMRQATRGDQRVTRLGRFLRRTGLDELPQLLNVLKGDMSLVGPRPHAPETEAAEQVFAAIVPHYEQRHCVRPGITGWAQVNGWPGEVRGAADIEMRVHYDIDYILNWSPVFDARILLLTLARAFNGSTAV